MMETAGNRYFDVLSSFKKYFAFVFQDLQHNFAELGPPARPTHLDDSWKKEGNLLQKFCFPVELLVDRMGKKGKV